jgi:hypothetical protein
MSDSIPAPITTTAGRIHLNASTTLFFPLSSDAPAARSGKRKRSLMDSAREAGRHWRDEFFRTESEEEIKARWEAQKLDLTRDWKRRHREAVKSQRRRGTKDVE